MSTVHRWDLGGAKILGSAKVTINSATTTNYDFGTPNDLDLKSLANYKPGDRILAIMSASTGGATDNLTFSVQDADDNAGNIGTPATADTVGDLAMTTGDGFTKVAVKIKSGRPWLRFRVTSTGATDTFVTHCVVLAIPSAL